MRGTAPRSVHLDGDAHEPIVTGDHNSVTVYRGGVPVFALGPLPERPAVPVDAGPAALLAARFELVDFTGRENARAQARSWLASDRRRAVRLMVAPGGQGKSRFALTVAREAAAVGWRVLVARHTVDGALLDSDQDDQPAMVPVPKVPAGTLVLVDYADRWPQEDLLQLLIRPETAQGRVRVLLLGRSGAFWSPFGRKLTAAGLDVSRQALDPLADRGDTRAVRFDAAVRSFADKLGVALGGVARPDLGGERFGLTLTVHMAALITVLCRRDIQAGRAPSTEPVLSDPAALSRELLIREVQHWETMMQRTPNPVRLSTKEMARAVLVATLTRGLPPPAARDLLQGLPIGPTAQSILDDHALCYPPARTGIVLEPLYPDRLGEDFVAAVLPGAPPDDHPTASLADLVDPTAGQILATLLAVDPTTPDPAGTDQAVGVLGSALTILVETARRWRHVAHHHLLPALQNDPARVLAAGGTTIARLATIPALAPVVPAVGRILNTIIGAGTHLELDIGAAAIAEQLVQQARINGDPAVLGSALTILAIRLSSIGRRAEGLAAAEEAVRLYRELVKRNRDAYLPDLAAAVNNLANRLGETGRRADGLAAAEEAVRLYRDLVERNRDAYLPDLATAVNNLANRLGETGRRADGLAAAQEAVRYYRELRDVEPERFTTVFEQAARLEQLFGEAPTAQIPGSAYRP